MLQYAETTRIRPLAPPRPRFVPWHVPAWLPRSAEGPATFLVGVVGGLVLAFCVSALASFVGSLGGSSADDAGPTSRIAAVVEPGARALIIARPVTHAARAAVDVAPEAAPPVASARPAGPRLVGTHAPTTHKTAIARPVPKRDVLLAAVLTP